MKVLTMRIEVHTHCYEAVDFDGVVRVSTEAIISPACLTDDLII